MTQEFTLPQDSLEQGLISAAIVNDNNWYVMRSRITSDDFATQRPIVQFIERYLSEYGNLPSSHVVASNFDWHPPLGDFAYWLTEMDRYVLARKVSAAMQQALLHIGKPQDALNSLMEELALIRTSTSKHIQAYDAGAQERFDNYLWRKDNLYLDHKLAGIRTGMSVYDRTGFGWLPGDLVGVYARPGVGKTWWLAWQGAMAWMDGHKVLVISGEMAASRLNMRFDTILGQMCGLPISHRRLREGDPMLEENYKKLIEIISSQNRWYTYDSNLEQGKLSLGDITSLIRQHQPDVVYIDNFHTIEVSGRLQEWEKVKKLIYDFKHLATVHDIPIIVTHHAVNSARGRRKEITGLTNRGDDFMMPSLNDAAYGDSFVGACSDVITMCGEETSTHINWYSIRKDRERGFENLSHRMAFAIDYDSGKLFDLGEFGFDVERVGEEARRLIGVATL